MSTELINNIILELKEANARIFVDGENLRIDSLEGSIKDELKLLIKENKSGLINYVKQIRRSEDMGIPVLQGKGPGYVLSSAQRRLWILSQVEEANAAYNMPGIYVFEGTLDGSALLKSFRSLIGRHEVLRTVFRQDGEGEVFQYVICPEDLDFNISYTDLRDEPDQSSLLGSHLGRELMRPFDLYSGPLIRASLYQTKESEWVFCYMMHHIVGDGWSVGIVLQELLQLYNMHMGGNERPMAPLRIQYKDYAAWQQQQLEGALLADHVQYWRAQLDGSLPVLELWSDRQRPAVKTYNGRMVSRRMDRRLTEGLRKLCHEEGATLFMGLLAAVNALLYRYTGQDDMIIGSPIAGRQHADLEEQIGFYVNMLALRTRFSGKASYRKLLSIVREVTLGAYEHQVYPFDELVEAVYKGGDPSRHPLFDVVVVLQQTEIRSGVWREALPGGLHVESYKKAERIVSLFDLRFDFNEIGGELHVDIEYNNDIYDRQRIERMSAHLESLLSSIVATPDVALNDLRYLEKGEEILLNALGVPVQECKVKKTLVDMFEAQVERDPEAVALVYEGETMSYRELNEQSNRLADFLVREAGIGSQEGVGLLMDRGLESIWSMLGVLKAGGMYVPMGADSPEERLKFMVEDADVRVLVTQKAYVELANRLQWSCSCLRSYICVDSEDVYGEQETRENPLMNRELWDHVGSRSGDAISGGGWLSSYTGAALGADEMEEYAMNVYKKLAGILHKDMKVLEIGCSSGLTLGKIAPEVGLYHGTDLSGVILEKTKSMVRERGWENVRLQRLAAHELTEVDENGFDLIIMNSVVQHFHGHNYLRKVLRDAVGLLKKKGWLFIGDVMDIDRKDELLKDLEAFKILHRGEGYVTKTDHSSELFLSKDFFRDISCEWGQIPHLSVSEKLYTIKNELTAYRFDVLMEVDKAHEKAGDIPHKRQYDRRALADRTVEDVKLKIEPDHAAYVIYTSGTTGYPKGVVIEHRNVAALFMGVSGLFDFGVRDVWAMFHSYSFDFSVWEMYGALLYGGKLVLVSWEAARDTAQWLSLLQREGVTILNQTPSAFYALQRADEEGARRALMIRYVIFGGEALDPSRLRSWRSRYPEMRLINMYGITETTVHVTFKEVTEDDMERSGSNIGRPISTLGGYVLDEYQQLLPLGVPGELYVSGGGLARGYLNRNVLTCERFIESPFIPGQRLYRTGDRVVVLGSGDLEYLGRVDGQVKIRGYRIELGEVEHALRLYEDIVACAVVARSFGEDKELVAYIVSRGPLEVTSIREHLSRLLPGYMVPGHYVKLDELPLTVNGKVNIAALPAPEGTGVQTGAVYRAPQTETERRLVKIWEDILGKKGVGVKDDFFEMGGHSLKATRLVSQIHKIFGTKIALRDLFSCTVLEDQALLIMRMGATAFVEISTAGEHEGGYELSSAQRRLWVLSQFEEARGAYNMPGVYVLEGKLHREALEHAFQSLISRHEILRTVFRENEDGQVLQYVLRKEEMSFMIECRDLSAWEGTPQDREALVKDLVEAELVRPFDLSKGPLLRATLYQVGQQRWVLTYVLHHIISDGWSMEIVVKELLLLYNAYLGGEAPVLTPLRIQYKDYARWQQSQLGGALFSKHREYWLKCFEGELPVLGLWVDKARPGVKTFNGGMIQRVIGKEMTMGFRKLCQDQEGTLFMGLLTVVKILLHRYTGQEDIVVGSPIAGREHADLEGQIGFYINTLALRSRFSGEDSFKKLLSNIREVTLGAYEHQMYPFDKLVDELKVERDLSRSVLFDVVVALQNTDRAGTSGELRMKDVEVSSYQGGEYRISKFDLSFNFIEVGDELHYGLEYNSDLYSRSTVERMGQHLEQLLEVIVACPDEMIGSLDYLSKEEKHMLLVDLNNTATEEPADRTVVELFREQVKKTPDSIAVVYKDTKLTYRELDAQSNQLAHYLRENYDISPDDRIGVLLGRSEKLIISMLGVLKSGGAYVPIDPTYPEERIEFILRDSDSKVLLDENELDMFYEDIRKYSIGEPLSSGTLNDLAYVIYTSGSTGKPKGVMVEHRNLASLFTHIGYNLWVK